MKEQQIKIYRCDFCNKKGFRKHLMERHEQFCAENPANKVACIGCKHLENAEIEIFIDGYNEVPDSSQKLPTFKCACNGQLMYHIKALEKNLIDRYPETFEEQIPMPKVCKMAEYHTFLGDDKSIF